MKTIKFVVVVVSASHKSYLNGFRKKWLSFSICFEAEFNRYLYLYLFLAIQHCGYKMLHKIESFLLDNKKLHKKYLKRDLRHSKPEFEFHVFFLLFSRTTSTAVSKKSILCYPVTWNHFPMQNQITSPISRVPIPLQVQSNQLLQSRVLQHHHEHVLPHLHHSIDDDRPH